MAIVDTAPPAITPPVARRRCRTSLGKVSLIMTTTALHIAVRARDVRPGSTRRRSEPNLRKRSAIVLCASPVCTHADQHRIKPYSAHVSPKCAHVLTISSGLATAFIRRLPNASVKLANAADANSDTDSRVIGREEEGGGARSRPRFAMHDTRAARHRCRSALCWNGAAVSQSNNSSASRRRRGRGGIVCRIAAASQRSIVCRYWEAIMHIRRRAQPPAADEPPKRGSISGPT